MNVFEHARAKAMTACNADADYFDHPGSFFWYYEESVAYSLTSPEDWWLAAMGSGYRGAISQLNSSSCMDVRETNLAAIKDISAITTNVIYRVL